MDRMGSLMGVCRQRVNWYRWLTGMEVLWIGRVCGLIQGYQYM